MKIKTNLSSGTVSTLTFRQFLSTLKVVPIEKDQDTQEFAILRTEEILGGRFTESIDDEDTGFQRKMVRILGGPFDQILKMQLMNVANTKLIKKISLEEMAEDAVTEHAYNMGNPKYFVRLSRRTWLVANPEDFAVYHNNVGVALATYRPDRVLVYIVDRHV